MTILDMSDTLAAASRIAGRHGSPEVGLDFLLLGGSALDALPTVVANVANPGEVVILEDSSAMYVEGGDLKALVGDLLATAGPTRRVVLGPADGSLHADTEAIARAAEAASGAGCLVAVGSGTLTDVAKEASRISGSPLVAVPTAASVNGYADGMAVLLKNGVKRTVNSAWPRGLVVDLRVLADAPLPLTQSGFAEMMAMFTAPADWRLAAAVGQDSSFDPAVVDLFRPQGESLLAAAPQVAAGQSEAVQLLALLLMSSGIAMGSAGRTAPLSGTEHLVSHLLDMSAAADSRLVGLHGVQVGVSAVMAACVWERVLERLDPAQLASPPPSPDSAQEMVLGAFAALDPTGRMGSECWTDYGSKLELWTTSDRSTLASSWLSVKAELSALVGDPEAIVSALVDVGAPTRFSQLDPPIDADRARWAMSFGHLMRDRFTVVDLAYLTGNWTDQDLDGVIKRAEQLGAGL